MVQLDVKKLIMSNLNTRQKVRLIPLDSAPLIVPVDNNEDEEQRESYEVDIDEENIEEEEEDDMILNEEIEEVTARVFHQEYIKQRYKMLRGWMIVSILLTCIFISFLVSLGATNRRYIRECSPQNIFSQFSMCVLVYLIIVQIKDAIISGSAMIITGRFLLQENRTLKMIAAAGDTSRFIEPSEFDIGREYHIESLGKMGKEIAAHTYKQNLITKIVDEKGGDLEGVVTPTTKNIKKLIKMNTLLGKDENNNHTEEDITNSHILLSGGKHLFLVINTISIITICFWIITGVDALRDIDTYRTLKGLSNDIPTFCSRIYIVNWILVAITLFVVFLSSLPPLMRLFYIGKNKV